MDLLQTLTKRTFPFLEDMIKNHGAFYPLATALKCNGEIEELWAYDGKSPDKQINYLKGLLRKQNKNYAGIAIFYEGEMQGANDCIAVLIEIKEEPKAFTYYYPFFLAGDTVSYSEPVIEECQKRIL